MTRRQILQSAALSLPVLQIAGQARRRPINPQLEQILARIKPPVFRNQDFDIRKFGAVPGGEKPATDAIRAAIEACSKAGGGRVVVPAAVFLTGAIHLESNVNLHVSKDATLKFSRDPKDYPIVYTRFESTECMNFSPFIYAWEKQNIAVTGAGHSGRAGGRGTLVAHAKETAGPGQRGRPGR